MTKHDVRKAYHPQHSQLRGECQHHETRSVAALDPNLDQQVHRVLSVVGLRQHVHGDIPRQIVFRNGREAHLDHGGNRRGHDRAGHRVREQLQRHDAVDPQRLHSDVSAVWIVQHLTEGGLGRSTAPVGVGPPPPRSAPSAQRLTPAPPRRMRAWLRTKLSWGAGRRPLAVSWSWNHQ